MHLEDLNIEAIHEGITSSRKTRYPPTDHDDSLGHATSSYATTDRYSADGRYEMATKILLGFLAYPLFVLKEDGAELARGRRNCRKICEQTVL